MFYFFASFLCTPWRRRPPLFLPSEPPDAVFSFVDPSSSCSAFAGPGLTSDLSEWWLIIPLFPPRAFREVFRIGAAFLPASTTGSEIYFLPAAKHFFVHCPRLTSPRSELSFFPLLSHNTQRVSPLSIGSALSIFPFFFVLFFFFFD